jgi:hypothetical protein
MDMYTDIGTGTTYMHIERTLTSMGARTIWTDIIH